MKQDRSYEKITLSDLRRLAKIAQEDREDLFNRKPLLRAYAERIICVALCQGAAVHFLDGKNGIKDFDVWTFYRELPSRPFPYRRNAHRDFGDPKFGTDTKKIDHAGRRVDLLGRSIPCKMGQGTIEAVQRYLSDSPNATPKLLSKKAIIIIEPDALIGETAWPPTSIR